MSEPTKKLIKIVEKRAGEPDSWSKAEQLLQQGADLKAPTKNGSMIDSVTREEKRRRPVEPWKADNCVRLIQVLLKGASDQLAAQVFSVNESDLNEMHQLVKLKANCYQGETFGSLGLLGSLLNQDKVPIRLDVVRFLLENDPDKNYSWATVDSLQQTCLSVAKKNSYCPENIVDYVQRQFDMILNCSPFNKPPINPNEVITWVRRGAKTEVTDQNENTVLSNAVKNNNVDLARVLISLGSNIMHKNREGLTPLQIAQNAESKNPILIAILDKQGVNVQLKTLIEAKRSRLTIDEVHDLLDKGVDINSTFANNDSLLHILIGNHGNSKMITAFVNDFNADMSATNINGLRPIETCIMLDKHPFERLLTFFKLPKMSTALFYSEKLNKTLLQFATEQQRPEVSKLIQDELNYRLWNCMACMNTNESNNKTIMNEVKQLINYGAEINYRHQDNVYQEWTILHLACKTTTKLTVQNLIESLKADYMLQNHHGDYPISIAAEYGQLATVEYLHGLSNLNLNVCNKDRQTPLHLATKNHHLLVAKYLVRWGADHQAQNLSKQTPLNVACANTAKNKEEEMSDKKLIEFFEQLICPPIDNSVQPTSGGKRPDYDLDTCELVAPVEVRPIQMSTDDVEGRLGVTKKGLFMRTHNENLYKAAKHGDIRAAQYAIGQGADIRPRSGERTPYEVALTSVQECITKLNSPTLNLEKRSELQNQLTGCQQIAITIQRIAQEKLREAINQSNASLVVAYHLAGAPLTVDLLQRACQAFDNVEIVDYLVNQSMEIHQAMINNSSHQSLYQTAKANKFDKLSAYLKYRLSIECTKAIKENNFELVKKLVRDGASVDMYNTNNIQVALQHQNTKLVQFLCQNGAKLPLEWLSAKTIVLPPAVSQQFKSEIRSDIDRCLINRRLRFTAASGDLNCMIQCQRLGADINSANYHGGTALFYTVQYGNYFPIVHALVSCGASMLYSSENESRSLIDLAKKYNYRQIADYLFKQLNVQFLTAVLNNERQNAVKFAELGANLNYQDQQKRTPLYYAVEHHGIELVKWLCECGSTPTLNEPDVNGDYPIILATEKGDYSVVEFFVTKYPATKNQINKAGLTALQIAERLNFKRIAELIRTGKPVEELATTVDEESTLTYEILKEAAENGHVKTINEFIKQRYESTEEKRRLCYELIQIAKKAKQLQVVDILEPYYDKNLKTELPSDMTNGSLLRISDHYKKVLFGLLSGLSNVIANSDVVLDPTDPNTYVNLFSNLTSNVAKRSQELQQVMNEQDVKKLVEQDFKDTNEQLAKITERLEQVLEEKESLQAHIEDIDGRLFKNQSFTALQRKQFLQEKEECRKKIAGMECTMVLYQRQQQVTQLRQKTMNFIKSNSNLNMFYKTIQNRLQALFTSVLAAQGGYVKRETTSVNITSTTVPFMDILTSNLKAAMSPVLSKLNEKEQKQEWHNISTLGNIEELNRIATETAGMVTLYYREQIQSIDSFQKMKGSNMFNDKVKWIKDFVCDVRPERSEEMAITMVAEYVTAWIIDALRVGKKEINPNESLPHQLWLYVARQDPVDQGTATKVANVVGISAGQQVISLRIKNSFNQYNTPKVQLRHLIGCVSVIGNNGSVYQYHVSKASLVPELSDLEIFGYVHVTPFSSDTKVFHSIIEGRHLKQAKRDDFGDIVTRFEDIIELAQTYADQNHENTKNVLVAQETANQVVEVLLQQKPFVNAKDLKDELKKTQEAIEVSIDVLREDIEEKKAFYQTSIEAAHEQIKQEAIVNRETMQKDNEAHYEQVWNKLNDKIKDSEKYLNEQMKKRMNDIEKEFQERTKEILGIVETAKLQSLQAMTEANQATQSSQKAAQQAEKAAIYAQNLVESTEERRKEFQSTASSCETTIKQTVGALKEFYEKTIADMRIKLESDVIRSKDTAREAANNAKEAARAAQESASLALEVQKTTKVQLELQKKETEKTIAGIKETRLQSERAVAEAREAEKHAKRATESGTAALNKVETALERIDKLARKL